MPMDMAREIAQDSTVVSQGAFKMKRHAMFGPILALLACEFETEDNPTEFGADVPPGHGDESRTPIFHADVGAPIDAATANRWFENYRRETGREPSSYTLPSATLKRALAAAGSVGIIMQLGASDAGEFIIFPRGVNRTGRAIDDSAESVDSRRAIAQYHGTARSHFFGLKTFSRLIDEGHSEAIRATLALDDALAPQLLLSNASEEAPRVYEDRSTIPCFDSCPQES